ncbi:acyl carrier protein [Thalassotalea piscium]|uniref:Acyl carrier protein n=1 Tax=Thalassotalea piscium TaxID=1230533 RepID=A0A7X0NEM9_9GAMM|nr:acyl carrier protein [Thalassotalea piscium]MBB6542015.1 acyl carrier protein [Thalassotalea piscium]
MLTVNKQVETIVAEYTDIPAEEFALATSFSDLAIDSLSVVEIVFDIEETFDIKIPNETDLQSKGFSVESYNDILKIVLALVKEKKSNE